MRAHLLVLCLLFLILGSAASVAINPRPAGFTVKYFLDQHNTDISNYWRTYKYDQLTLSPFIFYRGTNPLWWRDWSNNPALLTYGPPSTRTWVAGDLHIFNFGASDDADGSVVYETNDFDDGCPENYQHDLWRLATSVVLVARECGIPDADIVDLVHTLAKSYRKGVKTYAGSNAPDPESVKFTAKTTSGLLSDFLKDVEKKKGVAKMLKKWTAKNAEGQRVFNSSLPELEVLSQDWKDIIVNNVPYYISTIWGSLQNNYEYFTLKDVVRRIDQGCGSLGRNRFYVLVEGPSNDDDDDVILDVKEAVYPPSYLFATTEWKTQFDLWFPSSGFRHNTAYQAISRAADPTLGNMHFKVDGKDMYLYVRSRSPWKDDIPYCEDSKYSSASAISNILEWVGLILATEHSRADKRYNPSFVPWSFPDEFDVATSSDPSSFYDRVVQVAFLYADQVYADWAAFRCSYAGKC